MSLTNTNIYSAADTHRQRLSSKKSPVAQQISYLDDERERDGRIRDLKLAKPLSFAYGRLRLINAVLAYRHGGPCDTDDGAVYADLMLPFSVELAHLDRSCGFDLASRRFRYWMPKHVAEIGHDGLAAQWDDLCQMRSIAKSTRRTESDAGHVLWMPTADKIRDDLLLHSAERDAINALYPDRPPIRGVSVIDPPTIEERREQDRLRKQASRRAAGVRSQDSRTLNADDAALAEKVGCSAKTIQRKRLAGTLDVYLAERGFDVLKVSGRYMMGDTPGQFQDTPQDEADVHGDVMAMLRDIAADPYAPAWDANLVI